jgi:WD40 repeat protein
VRNCSASRDGDVSVWDMDAGTLIARARSGTKEIRDCALTPDGRFVISVHSNGRVTVWDLLTMAAVATLEVPRREPTDVQQAAAYRRGMRASPRRWRRFAVSPDSRRLAVAGWEAVDIWDLERFDRITTLEIEPTLPPGMLGLFFISDTLLTTIGRSPHAPVLATSCRPALDSESA